MSLLPLTRYDQFRVEEVSRLFVSGAMLLHEMLSEKDSTTFKVWASRLRDDTHLEEGIATDDRLMWLWDALRTEPKGTLLTVIVAVVLLLHLGQGALSAGQNYLAIQIGLSGLRRVRNAIASCASEDAARSRFHAADALSVDELR